MTDPEKSDVEKALEDFEKSQQVMLNSARRLVGNKDRKSLLWPLHVMPGIHSATFGKAAELILNDHEMTDGTKAGLLASTFVGAEERRVTYLNGILPEGNFFVASLSTEAAADFIESTLIEGADPAELCIDISGAFATLLSHDIRTMLQTLYPDPNQSKA